MREYFLIHKTGKLQRICFLLAFTWGGLFFYHANEKRGCCVREILRNHYERKQLFHKM
jgi:hypothetical protein